MFEYKSTASQLGYSTLTQAVLAAILDHSYRSIKPFTIAQLKVSPVALFKEYSRLPGAVRHISALKSGESDIPIADYRYFGDKAFGHKWQQNMRKVGLEMTDNQLQCLYLGVDPKDMSMETRINISVESPVGMAIMD